MTPQAQRIAIAEACGWQEFTPPIGVLDISECDEPNEMPDYLHDLNAMHEAEEVIIKAEDGPSLEDYLENLQRVCYVNRAGITYDQYKEGIGWNHVEWVHATAAQRAEAFLRTLNLWDDSK